MPDATTTARSATSTFTSSPFPSNLIASLFGFTRAEYFQLDAPEEGHAPEVKLAG